MTGIEWTDEVWNPTTGCDQVSPGCDHCYAKTMAKRLKGMGSPKYQTDGDPRTSGPGFGLTTHADTLALPLGLRKPKRIFVNSMSDLFHEGVPDEYIARVWAVMALSPQHTFQVLTKRHGRMRSLLSSATFWHLVAEQGREHHIGGQEGWLRVGAMLNGKPLANVWLGVSVENQQWADIRVPSLLGTPAAVRWLSCEPLLGPVDLTQLGAGNRQQPDMVFDALNQRYGVPGRWQAPTVARVDWVVVGGESGPKSRPMEPAWARSLRDQCTNAGVPFLFKQWGEWAPNGSRGIGAIAHISKGRERLVGEPIDQLGHREIIERVGKKAAGRELDGRMWDEYPTVATAVTG